MHPFFSEPRPYGIAHRGAAGSHPENTIEAFREALALGFRHIETDLRLTRDGELVCFHDPTIERTTDGRGEVSGYTLAELRRFDAGYRKTFDNVRFPFRAQGVRIPTFDELLRLDPTAHITAEIKPNDDAVADAVCDAITRHRAEERVLVASQHHAMTRRARERLGARLCTSAGEREIRAFWLAASVRAHRWLNPEYQALQTPRTYGKIEVVDRHFVRAAHGLGLEVHVWTINDPTEMHDLLDLGVDAIITDEPGDLRLVLNERAAVSRDRGASSASAHASRPRRPAGGDPRSRR
ncbi:MAG: glycerophosphodiester phosphodiesterase [Myxococcales bacterium]|nr:glycerophosphodiester phosphodiesterase [Myxococcales bacterium]